MKTNALELIIKAENDYQDTVNNAVTEAEKYVEDLRLGQAAYAQRLELEWGLFEQSENMKLEGALQRDKQQLEEETERAMGRLKDLQSRKLDLISDRLKEEVLSLHGDS